MKIIRYLQGERPGMSAGREHKALREFITSAAIFIHNIVLLADVSFYQVGIDFVKMKQAGIQGVIIRAGQRYWVDIKFIINWAKAKLAGLPRGSYWFYDSRDEPKKQAALWWSLIKDDKGELPHVVDCEEKYGGPYGSAGHIQAFILEFQRLSGLLDSKIVIYTGYYWWLSRVGNVLFFKRYKLWLAWYAAMSVVKVPLPWTEPDLLFWQFTSAGDGLKYGVSSKEIDLNWYCCTLQDYKTRFEVDLSNGGIMPRYYRLNTTAVRIRNGAGATYEELGFLGRDDVVQVDTDFVAGWANLKVAQQADGTPIILSDKVTRVQDRSDCWSSTGYFVEVAGLPNPPIDPSPPVGMPPQWVQVMDKDGILWKADKFTKAG